MHIINAARLFNLLQIIRILIKTITKTKIQNISIYNLNYNLFKNIKYIKPQIGHMVHVGDSRFNIFLLFYILTFYHNINLNLFRLFL